jgi:hypothetical protein
LEALALKNGLHGLKKDMQETDNLAPFSFPFCGGGLLATTTTTTTTTNITFSAVSFFFL